jgi:hypothetical protein
VPGTGVVAVVEEEEKEEDNNNKEVVDDEFGIDDDYNEEFRHEERQTKIYLHKGHISGQTLGKNVVYFD